VSSARPPAASRDADPGAYWRALFAQAVDPMLVFPLDAEGRPLPYAEVNEAALALYGYSREEMLERSVYDIAEAEQPAVDAAVATLREQPDVLVRGHHRHRTGERLPVEVHARLMDLAGRPVVFNVVRDLRPRLQAEAEARARERRFSEVLERTSDDVLVLDRDWRILQINPAAAAAIGPQAQAAEGKVFWEAFPQLLGTEIEASYRRAMETREPVVFEGLGPLTGRYIEVQIYPTEEGLVVFGRDFTERYRAEGRRRRQSERLRALAEASLAVTQAASLGDKLQALTEAVRRVVRAHQAVVSLTQGPDWRQAINAVSLSEKYAARQGYDRAPNGSGIYAEVCRTNRPIRLTQEELEAHPLWRGFGPHAHEHPPMNGWLAVPLVGGSGENLGLLQASDKEDGSFTENDEAALVQLAQFASAAIEAARAEEARLEAAERFRVIVSQALVGVKQVDLEGRFTYVNDRFAEMVGYAPEELLGRSMQEITHPEDLPRNLPSFHETAAGGSPFIIEKRYVRKDGSHVWVSNTVGPLLDAAGEPFAVLAVVLDVTERRAQEEALRENEMRLRLALEAAALGAIEVDLESGASHRSHRYNQIFGYEEAAPAWTRELLLQHILPEDREAVATAYEHARATLSRWHFVCRIRRTDGAVRWIEAQGAPLSDPRGGTPRMIGLVADITERREQEEALRSSEARYRALTELAPELVYTARPNGSIDYFNQAWFDYTGMTPDDPFDEWILAVHPDHRQWAIEAFSSSIEAGTDYEAEVPLRRRDGTYRWHLDRARPIRDEDGTIRRWIGVAVDTHDRIETQAQLEALNASLEERVAERTAVAEDQARQIRRLAAELTRAEQRERRRIATALHDNLQQLLAAARFHLQPTVGEKPALAQVDDLLAEAIEVSRSLTVQLSPPVLHESGLGAGLAWLARWVGETHGLEVALTTDPAAEPEDEDVRVLLFEAVRELLFNTVKHAGVEEAEVVMEVHGMGHVRITVRDAGVGFALPPGLTPSGLGLPSIRERMGYVGGEIFLDSNPGTGTRVTVIAPRTAALSAPSADPARPSTEPTDRMAGAPLLRPIRVLLVDDHQILRAGLSSLLRDEQGIEVVGEAEDGVEAVDLALTLEPDVILMDVTMPRMGGVEATERITAKLPSVRVIGLSMHTEADMAARLREAGAAAYVTKGGAPAALIRAIREVGGRE
jgi:PAS domain S-box-containing protein